MSESQTARDRIKFLRGLRAVRHFRPEPVPQVVIDDILDEGITLAAIRKKLLEMGAAKVYCAVFADKAIGRDKPVRADFVGVTVPNRYVFGFGMDAYGLWRNLPAIYALKEQPQ